MSGFSLGSLFGMGGGATSAAPAAPAAAPADASPQQGAPTSGQQQAPATQQAAPKADNPLDFLAQLHNNSGGGDQGKPAPRLQLDAESLGKVTGSKDFSKAINPAHMERLQSGDMGALGDILQEFGRAVYQSSLQDASYLTDNFVESRFSHADGQLTQRLDQRLATHDIQGINDLHPLAQSMFKDTVSRLRSTNPNASQADLQEGAWNILSQLGNQFDRTGRQQQQQAKLAEPDWDAYGGFAESKD